MDNVDIRLYVTAKTTIIHDCHVANSDDAANIKFALVYSKFAQSAAKIILSIIPKII
jgi:hypothetical protein